MVFRYFEWVLVLYCIFCRLSRIGWFRFEKSVWVERRSGQICVKGREGKGREGKPMPMPMPMPVPMHTNANAKPIFSAFSKLLTVCCHRPVQYILQQYCNMAIWPYICHNNLNNFITFDSNRWIVADPTEHTLLFFWDCFARSCEAKGTSFWVLRKIT